MHHCTETGDDKRNHVFSLYEVGRRDKSRALFDICMSDRSLIPPYDPFFDMNTYFFRLGC